MSDLVFWQKMVSPHQAAFLEAMAEEWRALAGETHLIVDQMRLQERDRQGWQQPRLAGVNVLSQEDGHSFQDLKSLFMGKNATHVISGFHASPLAWKALRAATHLGERTIVQLERPQLTALSTLKALTYHLHKIRFGHRIQGLLAYGEIGVKYYRDIGFPEGRVFPICYVVEPPTTPPVTPAGTGKLELMFVGSQLKLKGLDLLLAALAEGSDKSAGCPGWQLTVITADDDTEYRHMAAAHGLSSRITWLGPTPNHEVRMLMATADALILPSRYDGWGAVVNEALHAGARVIVSDECGASCLIQAEDIGTVFQSESVAHLCNALKISFRIGRLPIAHRKIISSWAERAISARPVARYVRNILISPADVHRPPWQADAGDFLDARP